MELNENRPVNTAGITKEQRVKRVYLRTVIVLLICIVVGRIGITLYFKNEYKNYVTVEAVVTDCFTEEGGDGDDDNYIYYVVYDYTYNGGQLQAEHYCSQKCVDRLKDENNA